MKKFATLLLTILLCLSFVACGNEKDATSEEQTTQATTEATEAETTTENTLTVESSEVSTEFEIPVQSDFVTFEGLSDNYADLENRAFAYNGKVFKLGESTLKDLIDGGIPFDETELNNKGNNVNSNYETSSYTVEINDYTSMQFRFINITDEAKTEEECLLSYVRYYYLYVPQPDYDADLNTKITECMLDASKKVHFSFPATLTKEQLLENSSVGAEQDEYNNVSYTIDSEIYLGDSGYNFEFNKTTNQLEEMSIDWLP